MVVSGHGLGCVCELDAIYHAGSHGNPEGVWVNATELEALNLSKLLRLYEDVDMPYKTPSREDLFKEVKQAPALAEMSSKSKSQNKLVQPNGRKMHSSAKWACAKRNTPNSQRGQLGSHRALEIGFTSSTTCEQKRVSKERHLPNNLPLDRAGNC